VRTKLFAVVVVSLSIWSSLSLAKKVEGVEIADQHVVGTANLALNGVGVRIKRKLGIGFRVYVGALYLAGKTSDEKLILTSAEPKILELTFLRSVDADTLRDAWKEGFEKNCGSVCEKAKPNLKSFNDLMIPVKEGSRITMVFTDDGVNVTATGKETKSAMIPGQEFKTALLSIFIGPNPPTPELKKGLLGL
jgi:hypothetical protein